MKNTCTYPENLFNALFKNAIKHNTDFVYTTSIGDNLIKAFDRRFSIPTTKRNQMIKDVIEMRYKEGLKVKEIAEKLGITTREVHQLEESAFINIRHIYHLYYKDDKSEVS